MANNNKILLGLLITLILGAYAFTLYFTSTMGKALAENMIMNDRLRASEDQRIEINHKEDIKDLTKDLKADIGELQKQLLGIEKILARIEGKIGK